MSISQPRIAFFIGALNAGGAERVMAWLANRLVVDRHEVAIITLKKGGEDFPHLDPRVQRIALDLYGGNSGLLKLAANYRRIAGLRCELKRLGVDRLVAFMPHESVMAVLAGWGLPVRVVISERNAPWRRSPGFMWERLRRLLYRKADVQVAQTRAIAAWFEREAACDKVEVIPNAVANPLRNDPPFVAAETVLDTEGRLVLAVGTKPFQKGFDMLVEAFARVAADNPEWKLAILGLRSDAEESGLTAAELQHRVQQLGLAHRVHFPGVVGNMADWYAASDLFVLSSRFEGFPNVLIEAMSSGTACVAFDCETGPGDIVDDTVNGILVRDGDVEALSGALARVMGDDHLRRELAANATVVTEKFGEDEIYSKWRHALALAR